MLLHGMVVEQRIEDRSKYLDRLLNLAAWADIRGALLSVSGERDRDESPRGRLSPPVSPSRRTDVNTSISEVRRANSSFSSHYLSLLSSVISSKQFPHFKSATSAVAL